MYVRSESQSFHRQRWNRILAGAMLLASLAAGVRLAPWFPVLGDGAVQFLGNDAYYHALRMQQIVDDYPHVEWYDGNMNYPDGAAVPWPPLFDHLAASAAMALGLGDPSPDLVERVAAFFPVVVGVITLLLVAILAGTLLGGDSVPYAVFLVAVLPAHVLFSSLGRFDQHCAELLMFTWILLAFVRAWHPRSRRACTWIPDVALGLGIAVSFWIWPGSGMYVLFLATFCALLYIAGSAGDVFSARASRSLARGGTLGAALLASSILVLAPDGALREMRLLGLTGFHVVIVAMSAGLGGLLWWLHRRAPTSTRSRRGLEVLIAAPGVVAICLIAFPGFANAVWYGVTALSRTSAWYQNIQEFDPLIFTKFEPLSAELAKVVKLFGLGLFLLPVAAVHLFKHWRLRAEHRAVWLFLLFWGGVFAVAAVTRQRFAIYLVIPLAMWLATWWRDTADTIAQHGGRFAVPRTVPSVALGLVLVAPTALWYLEAAKTGPNLPDADLLTVAEWLRDQPSATEGREGVLAEWTFGHQIQYVADKPVMVNPFGTAVGRHAMEDEAAFFLTIDPRVADEIVDRRRMGFVLLRNPVTEAYFALPFAPPGTTPVVEVSPAYLSRRQVVIADVFGRLVVSRLYFFDGMATPGSNTAALGRYRLVYESSAGASYLGITTKRFKVFEVVAGALVTVTAAPHTIIAARTRLETNQGRVLTWTTSGLADAEGNVTLRLPYAVGSNGAVRASPWTITDGQRREELAITALDVAKGSTIRLDLSGADGL